MIHGYLNSSTLYLLLVDGPRMLTSKFFDCRAHVALSSSSTLLGLMTVGSAGLFSHGRVAREVPGGRGGLCC